MPRRILLRIEYDGTDFVGWQRQKNGRSVQEAIENSVKALFGESVTVIGAGRTDSGVHASGQAAHLDLNHTLSPATLPAAMNSRLPEDVRILSSREVPSSFNARRDAVLRRYRYLLVDGPPRPSLHRRTLAWVPSRLSEEKLRVAAQSFLGKHDFAAFRAASCTAESSVRTITRFDVERAPGSPFSPRPFLVMTVESRSFLQRQVRMMVGALLEVGRGARPETWPAEALELRTPGAGGPSAPPEGLVLADVFYPPALLPSEGS